MSQRSNATLARLAPLAALMVLVLIPYGWIAEHLAWLDIVVGQLFATEAAHALAHSVGFIAVGSALLWIFPRLLARPWAYFSLIAAVALAQEGLQLITKGRGVALNDITDIGTDLVAAGLLFALARRAARARRAPPRGTVAP
jgi:hypothetical protein